MQRRRAYNFHSNWAIQKSFSVPNKFQCASMPPSCTTDFWHSCMLPSWYIIIVVAIKKIDLMPKEGSKGEAGWYHMMITYIIITRHKKRLSHHTNFIHWIERVIGFDYTHTKHTQFVCYGDCTKWKEKVVVKPCVTHFPTVEYKCPTKAREGLWVQTVPRNCGKKSAGA